MLFWYLCDIKNGNSIIFYSVLLSFPFCIFFCSVLFHFYFSFFIFSYYFDIFFVINLSFYYYYFFFYFLASMFFFLLKFFSFYVSPLSFFLFSLFFTFYFFLNSILFFQISQLDAAARSRSIALKCLLKIRNFPYPKIHPYKNKVVKGVGKVTDDRKRAIRLLAARVRNEWLILGLNE